ncbi:diguanylate cyclase [Bacillus luteolus]|uniref:Diguanylate cyclase n=1 Tax=Litchfieldia luteola TaxID=682179 RepID=A0ABR9QF63_9BACI|nr:diguanylate cyclase [Cytobacillus luteolus]MBE4907131.1 diguanylate cyclase [Cytobacillus luteolus]MBP1943399.1 diguanylate cyclase (GGDEF)-like protein/putative nucleotidyltransferase with HDIG domain [Cytobacillus luteolus]
MKKLRLDSLYATLLCIIGVLFFVGNYNLAFSQWELIGVLTAVLLLLNFFNIVLPPSGNSLSMDSAIYLASLFLFGLEVTLSILLVTTIIWFMYYRKIAWWKHLFNFASYSLTIVCTYSIFTLMNGVPGIVDFYTIIPYIFSLATYFLLNVLIYWGYFAIASPSQVTNVIKGAITKAVLKESFTSYFSLLILSLILTILMKESLYFGLLLFTVLSVFLSFAFKNFFDLYKDTEEKSKIDFLTRLYNHGFFKLKLDEMFAENEDYNGFTVALLDIDDFKKYNDTNGHLQGDELLKFFGKFIKEKMSTYPDMISARYGGEEFAILMPNTSVNEAVSILNRIRKEVNDTHFKGVEYLPLGCISFSAGVVEFAKGTYGSSELLRKADKALYFAKAQGKNCVQVYHEGNNVYDNDLYLLKEVEKLEQQLQIFLAKDIYTYQHSKRVFTYATDLSSKLELSNEEKRNLILGALIHDIGKLEIPRDVINKKGKLDSHEWEMMKKHVTWGKEIISSAKKYNELIPLIELHHERFDGKGYPFGLEEENIPKLARILCVIDSFDAMTTERPYQKTKTFGEAIVELRKCAGKQFDPAFVEPFIEMIEEKYPQML